MIKSTRVKICGLTRSEDVEAAVKNGADYIGFVFAESPRKIDPSALKDWLEDLRENTEVVGVFQNQSVEEIESLVAEFDLDLVQLHGKESGKEWIRFPVRLIECRQVINGEIAATRFAGSSWAHLLDQGGGSGQQWDYELAREEARSNRVFLAGGLNISNIREAIAASQPFAVDVSSGIESVPAKKDHALMSEFLRLAKGNQ